MTLHAASPRCVCSQCAFSRARAERARQRMGLIPLYSPAAATRDAAVGGSTSEVAGFDETTTLEAMERAYLTTYSPAVTTRDVTAEGSTSSVCHGDTVPESVGRLGDVVTLDDLLPGGVS